eukprot:UN00612
MSQFPISMIMRKNSRIFCKSVGLPKLPPYKSNTV